MAGNSNTMWKSIFSKFVIERESVRERTKKRKDKYIIKGLFIENDLHSKCTTLRLNELTNDVYEMTMLTS